MKKLKFEEFRKNVHNDGIYDTCPKYGPKYLSPKRRVKVEKNTVELLNEPRFSWTVSDFFDVNFIVTTETKE